MWKVFLYISYIFYSPRFLWGLFCFAFFLKESKFPQGKPKKYLKIYIVQTNDLEKYLLN